MIKKLINEFQPDYSIHPGEILRETIETRNMSKGEFADRCGISFKTISQIINLKAPITLDTAIQFERVLGVSAEVWYNLDSQYKLYIANKKQIIKLGQLSEWANKFPLNILKKKEIISNTRDRSIIADELLKFFGVATIDAWNKFYGKLEIAFRKSNAYNSSFHSVIAWLRLAELIAEDIETNQFNMKKFISTLYEIRNLTTCLPIKFEPVMRKKCQEKGIAIVFSPELPKTRLYGATRWLSKKKALLALTLRYKSDDQFWFSFFHEAGHIVLHEQKRVFIDSPHKNGGDTLENEADEFARNILIPKDQYNQFLSHNKFYKQDIINFSNKIGIAPGIVVGRLQYDGIIKHEWHNDLKKKFELIPNE